MSNVDNREFCQCDDCKAMRADPDFEPQAIASTLYAAADLCEGMSKIFESLNTEPATDMYVELRDRAIKARKQASYLWEK